MFINNMKKIYFLIIILIFFAFFLGIAIQKYGVFKMNTTYIKTLEPLLLNSEGKTENFHVLPSHTPLYKYYDNPEGGTTYIIYINIKGDFTSETVQSEKANLIDPIWGHPIQRERLETIVETTPISKDDLLEILKARKMTKADLAQIIREWKD
jgi:hypothetical protein